jgi:pyruvate dehydrogenase E1 component
MPDFWEFPTVSMGLGPIMAIYQARFNRYLETAASSPTAATQKVWAFLGDGETDEPETLGAITLAAREKLDNLIFVINCNLQRLDGPVRGNGKIIQELEAAFRGAGWNVIKVHLGQRLGPAAGPDTDGAAGPRMGEVVDGEYQKYTSRAASYIREHFFGADPELLELVEHLSDEQLRRLRRGGHDPEKVYAAYKAPSSTKGAPTVILAKTIKGYGWARRARARTSPTSRRSSTRTSCASSARASASRSPTRRCRRRRSTAAGGQPGDAVPARAPQALGGYLPSGGADAPIEPPKWDDFRRVLRRQRGREVSTTMAFVRMLAKLLRDKDVGKLRRADRARRGAHLRHGGAVPPVRHLLARRAALRAGRPRHLLYYKEARTARSSRRASPRPARCRRSSPPARPTPPTASTRSRSSSTTRCSASSASAT